MNLTSPRLATYNAFPGLGGSGGGTTVRTGQVPARRGRDPHILASYMEFLTDAVQEGYDKGVLPEGTARRALESLADRDVVGASDEILAGIEVAHENQFDMAAGALTDTLAAFAAPTAALLKQALNDPDAVVTTGRGALSKVNQLSKQADSILRMFGGPEAKEESEAEESPRRAQRRAKRSREDEPAEQEESEEGVSGLANTCPECGEDAQLTCRCAIGDSTCTNGHRWVNCSAHDRRIPIPFDAKTHGLRLDSRAGHCLCDIHERLQAASQPPRAVQPERALGRELTRDRGAHTQVAAGDLGGAQSGSLNGWQHRRAPASYRDPNVLIDTDGVAARLG